MHAKGARIDELPSLWDGFARLVRPGLDLSAFGANVMNLPPDYSTKSHDESGSGQEELYVRLAGCQPEDRAAAHAIQRLHHHLAVLGDEGLERRGIARDQGGRAALREFQRPQLFVEVAQALRVVDHHRPGALRQAQDLGVVEVVGVDRRVLAHQHDMARTELNL